MDLRNKLEALLFASGHKLELKEIAKLCSIRDIAKVKEALMSLQQDYTAKDGALKIIDEGDSWKLSVKDSHVPLIRQIVTETELSKSVMETLAVIAWKNPVLQSDVIRIRTNKAYDHLDQLEESGYIARAKHGRTKKVALTEKFFSYFDLPQQDFKKFLPEEICAKVEAAEADIDNKERILEDEERKKQLELQKQKQLKVYEEAGALLSFEPKKEE